MTSKVDICYRGLNVITYLKDCYCLYRNENLSTRQKLCGIAPRILGLVADGGTAFSGNKDLKIISNLISGILPLPDALVNETSCGGASVAVVANGVRLGAGSLPESSGLLITSVIDKKSFLENILLYALKGLKRTFFTKTKEQLIETDESRIQTKKTQFLEHLKTQENIKQAIESRQNALLIQKTIQAIQDFQKGLSTQENTQQATQNHQLLLIQKAIEELIENDQNILLVQEAIQQALQDYQNILNNASADTFGAIPYYYFHRPEFQKRTCGVSHRPIRNAVVIRKTPTSHPIYYEYDMLLSWYKQEKEKSPSSWPQSIPFNLEIIKIDRNETAKITEDLQKTLELTQNSPQELEDVKIGLLAVKEALKDFIPQDQNIGNL